MSKIDERFLIDKIPFLNENNQLNLPFSQNPILVNSQDYSSRVFYVDQENGDDNNPGTADAPFKTLKKAIDSVPVSGYGEIYILNDYVVTPEENIIYVMNKNIKLILYKKLVFVPVVRECCGSLYKGVTKFIAYNSSLHIYTAYMQYPQLLIRREYPSEWSSAYDHSNGSAVFSAHNSTVEIFFDKTSHTDNTIIIDIPEDFILFSVSDSRTWAFTAEAPYAVFSLSIYSPYVNVKFILDGLLSYISAYAGSCVLNVYATSGKVSMVNSDGDNIDIKNKIGNIIRDSNGVPRNILSNKVF